MRRSFILSAKVAATSGLATLLGLSAAGAATAAPGLGHLSEPAGCAAGPDARDAADAYLDSLVSHDAADVPFAPDVLRVENGLVTGRSADEIRNDLNTSIKYKIITGLRDRTYTESGPAADGTVTENVDYRLDVGVLKATLLTVRVRERFDVRCGQITYINATIGLW
jgi:hypothetical protein